MKTSYLFPYRFKKISGIVFWTILIITIYGFLDYNAIIENDFFYFKVFAVADTSFLTEKVIFGVTKNYILDEILFFLLIVSGLIYAFSKEKIEDEMVSKIRLESLVWATYFNYISILLCYMFLYGFAFLNVMMIALFSHLLFFIVRFRWMMYKQNKSLSYEE